MSTQLDISVMKKQSLSLLSRVYAYRGLVFFLCLASLYGYLVWRINVLSNTPPSQADIDSAKQNITQPHISNATIKKLESLQDNSVRVKELFNEARQNPFQE